MDKIKIIRGKKATDYTFTGDGQSLDKLIDSTRESINTADKKDNKGEQEYRLRTGATKLDKLKHKSKMTGGHNMQGHSPVYE